MRLTKKLIFNKILRVYIQKFSAPSVHSYQAMLEKKTDNFLVFSESKIQHFPRSNIPTLTKEFFEDG
jgi:hypothetical protein